MKLTETQSVIASLACSENVPALEDNTIVVILSEVIHGVHGPVDLKAAAMLCTIAASLLRRIKLPVASFRDATGQPVFSAADLASVLGISEREAQARMEALLDEMPEHVYKTTADTLIRVN